MIKVEFSGTDGAGKSLALTYFAEQARNRGLTVVETREVGNPNVPVCIKLRELVLDPNSGLCGEAMELIFSAMRYENDRWLRKLAESSNPPDFVVSDRGYYDHLAYTDHNVSPEFTDLLYKGIIQEATLWPDVVIYFRVSTDTALKRRVKRGTGMDVIEMKGIEFQEKVRESFETHLYNEYTSVYDSLYVIDANDTIEGVQKQLDAVLDVISENTPRKLVK